MQGFLLAVAAEAAGLTIIRCLKFDQSVCLLLPLLLKVGGSMRSDSSLQVRGRNMQQKKLQTRKIADLSHDKMLPLVAFVVAIATLLVYLNVLGAGLVNVDDPDYVLSNPLIRQLNIDSLVSMFTESHLGWWMPLTWLSLAVDYHIWEYNPFGYHLTNIVLHAINSGLVVYIADQLLSPGPDGKKPGLERAGGCFNPALLLLAGLLWGLHPLRVESVAWVTERKDVLNGFFTFGSMHFYLRYARVKASAAGGPYASWELRFSLALFLMSLMAKSVSVVLPLMLLVLDWFPLRRLRRGSIAPVILEKIPFLAGSAALSLVTIFFAARNQHLVPYDVFPLSQRLVVSGNAVWEYCRMLFFPVNLSPFYVIPDPISPIYAVKTLLVVILLLFIFCCKRLPWLQSCLLCFLLPLLPVLAFFQNGDQAFADRFTYLPSLAPAIVASGLLVHFAVRQKGWWRRSLMLLAPAGLLILFFFITLRLFAVWQSSETYWTRVIDVQPTAISYKERGRYYHSIGRYPDAVKDFTLALGLLPETLKPYQYNFYAFRGESLRSAGLLEASVEDFSRAISSFPHPTYFHHRGLALQVLGRAKEAAEDFRRSGGERGPIIWFDAAV